MRELGGQFHHHAVLVERVVDNPHLTLAERVIERVVDGGDCHAQARRRVTVDDQRSLQALVLLVGVDVCQLGQQRQCVAYPRLPGAQVCQVVGLQGVLVLCIGLACANANVLHRYEEKIGAGFVSEFVAKSRNHGVGGDLSFRKRFERDVEVGRIALSSARGAVDIDDRGIGAEDGHELVEPLAHHLKRAALVGLHAAHYDTRVLLRKKRFWDGRVQVHV